MTRNREEEVANVVWDQHLLGCNACNYDQDCMMCEVGDPDGRPDSPERHSCNCKHGPETNGYHLFQKTTYGRRMARQKEQFDLGRRRSDLMSKVELKLVHHIHDDPDWFTTSIRELLSDAVLGILKDPEMRTVMGELIKISDRIAELDSQAENRRQERIKNGEIPF